MVLMIIAACAAGMLIGVSRQVNGRLSLSTSPLIASTWSHIVGFVALSALGVLFGALFPADFGSVPWHAYFGGLFSVLYVVGGSWAIVRIGAVNTALMVIGGQMISGVVLDVLRETPAPVWALSIGVIFIIGGVALLQQRR